jgi:uncharacterized tellurite resistance protein B-like protein
VCQTRIEAAKRRAALEGTLTSDAFNGTVRSLLDPESTSEDVVLPDSVKPFVADLLFTTSLQLRLAHDLCVIFGRSPDLDDPWDLFDLVRIAFGAKAGDVVLNYLKVVHPEVATRGLDRSIPDLVEAVQESLPMLGKHRMRCNVVKYMIPFVSVPLNAGLNYYFTSDIAHMAGKVLPERTADPDALKDLASLKATSPKLLLSAIWLIIIADGTVTEGEKKFINNLTLKLTELEGGEETIQIMQGLANVDEAEVVGLLSQESDEVKKVMFEVICDVAAIDHKIHRKEKKIVERLAKVCGMPFDIKNLKQLSKWK